MITDQLSHIAVAAWIRAQVHPTDCICSFCAPVSTPTRSPIINDALAGRGDSGLAQVVALFPQLDDRHQRQAILLMKCGIRVEGKMG